MKTPLSLARKERVSRWLMKEYTWIVAQESENVNECNGEAGSGCAWRWKSFAAMSKETESHGMASGSEGNALRGRESRWKGAAQQANATEENGNERHRIGTEWKRKRRYSVHQMKFERGMKQ